MGSRSWNMSSKNCNRRWNMAPPVLSWRQNRIMAMTTKRWKWRLIQSKGHGSSFFGILKAFLLVDFLEGQRIITSAYYENVLRKSAKALAEKWPGKFHRRVLLHHASAPAHSSHQTVAILQEFWSVIIRYPPYNLDLALFVFFLFPNGKERHLFLFQLII